MGVYNRTKRVWRKKQKNKVTALSAFDLDGDGAKLAEASGPGGVTCCTGVPELIAGLSNGRIEVPLTASCKG